MRAFWPALARPVGWREQSRELGIYYFCLDNSPICGLISFAFQTAITVAPARIGFSHARRVEAALPRPTVAEQILLLGAWGPVALQLNRFWR